MTAEVWPGSVERKSHRSEAKEQKADICFILPPLSFLPQWPSCRPMAAVTLLNLWNTQESKLALPLLPC